ncbi:MAG: trifunctional transcriptional regulator/proline dehydrogenase/L-glutamate gamma-semialdehyde dehydrogenase [Acidiphilium sp. 34-60-192]|nr:MAG: trifunctional transcriptional regulator/proline dehydrogenase/L-glutamate gamma-semialdehyde dehydrogenase [Acidiphilium sp. 34-60-192]
MNNGFDSDFAAFALASDDSPLRAAIRAAFRRPEPDCLPPLLDAASCPADQAAQVQALAQWLVTALRDKGEHGLVESLLQEYALSTQEGVALMCLAEALLRIPDTATRDALIRDKIGRGDWRKHVGASRSPFVNAATWGLLVTGKLTATASETGLSSALTRLIAKGGEPLIRQGVHVAMRLMGEQFVIGQTIESALANSRKQQARGFGYSYDMLGEAALTAADAARYNHDYAHAISAIGQASRHQNLLDGPGISIKLSALHPRYSRAQRDRVMGELLPRLLALVEQARAHNIGINIDAEEADRLDISLDLLEQLCAAPSLQGWDGIGFVRSNRRLMVRLVKGAYWDSEIKRAQLDGLAGFPVFTRKAHTDVSYLACARRMLAAPQAIFPQFATHNAQTLAAIYHMAGPTFRPGDYEFQCLHGMAGALYHEVVGADKLNRPCRIYAPVGTHETLLAYLVRRLLENGANSSFINQIADPTIDLAKLTADPVQTVRAMAPIGAPHAQIALPGDIFAPVRANSPGLDLSDDGVLAALQAQLRATFGTPITAAPIPALIDHGTDHSRPVLNPANPHDQVGTCRDAMTADIAAAFSSASAETTPHARAAILRGAADALIEQAPHFIGLLLREAGKTLAAAMGEVREAVDFLRYYAAAAERLDHAASHAPSQIIVAISPWNFPLAIFTGQIAAALAAGHAVLAKPAEETPLIAAEMVRLLHRVGIAPASLQLLPGDGAVGAALVADPRVSGVLFTGSTEAARSIQRSLSSRLDPTGHPVRLVAETGGQNAMVIDSSALLEQAVADLVISAFDSAGQRCSAARIVLVQADIADRFITMLKGAMQELRVGKPDTLSSDIGPVINNAAASRITDHIAALRACNYPVFAPPLPETCTGPNFIAPTLIEIPDLSVLGGEIFGPVLHLLRFEREQLGAQIDQVNALGYGLTFGVHSRIDETIELVSRRIRAGNLYVNRTMIGAVVGVQPFGGHGLSGTGPKAGGPLYLPSLNPALADKAIATHELPLAAEAFRAFLQTQGIALVPVHTCLGLDIDLLGPVGERNRYWLEPRGSVLCVAETAEQAWPQIFAALATGNRAIVDCPPANALLAQLSGPAADFVHIGIDANDLALALHAGSPETTAAAGGNASLMALA